MTSSDMSSTVRIVDATDEEQGGWDALAVRAPRGEAFQGHAWGELKRGTGWTPRRYRIEDAGGPLAVISIQERELLAPLARRLPGPLGGSKALRRIARSRRAALFVMDPTWEAGLGPAALLADAGFRPAARSIQVATTGMLVPLEADEAAQRKHLNENAWRNVNRCRKAGVQVVRLDVATPPMELDAGLEVAYEMLAETGRRRGFGEHLRPAEYHNAGMRGLIRSGAASLWFALREGREAAHTLVHHCGRRAVLFQAGEGAVEQKRVPANFLLQWEIIRWAAGAGFTYYDMGGVDNHEAPGLPTDESHPVWSLFRFKSQWGAQPVQFCGAQEYAPWPLLGASVRAVWRRRSA
ncbi:MAG: GNAT family N-acetyltransferase [Chloroflexi bacterium]|nr:GNAT family N-acetyltransferase [Chloroflexota bacterium]